MYSYSLDRLCPDFADWILLYWDAEGQSWYEDTYAPGHTYAFKIDPDIKQPFMRQFTIGLERELFKDASFSVTYINRSYHNFIDRVQRRWRPMKRSPTTSTTISPASSTGTSRSTTSPPATRPIGASRTWRRSRISIRTRSG